MALQGEAGARQAPRGVAQGARPSISAARAAEAPSIDGRLDDAIWRSAPVIDKFTQTAPNEGTPASEQTEVHVAYDSQRLYVSIYAHYADRGTMRANRVDRDKTDEEDTVTISLDPFLDQQSGYSFSVNGYGVQADSILNRNANGSQGDAAWNVLFASAGQLVEDGWTAEMAIPFKSLRYPARGPTEAHRWGLQIEREIKSKNETDHWAPISRDVSGYLRQMGALAGMTNLSTSRNFELLPTFTAVKADSLNKTTGVMGTDEVNDGGVDLKYGLTSTLTLDFTYNPDFSQIESDRQQIEVNQRFAVQYPELRPFFLEGANIFAVQGPAAMVHTRTIVDPRFGAKLTGKVGKTTMGFLVANDEAPGKIDDASDPAFKKDAQVFIVRTRYDYKPENSVGMLFTNREFLGSSSRLGGIDANFRLSKNQRMTMFFMMSKQTDLTGKEKSGHIFEFNTRKDGRNFGYFIVHHWLSPGLGSDLGFIRRTNWVGTQGTFTFKWWPENWIVNWGPEFKYGRTYDYDAVLQNVDSSGAFIVQFARNISATATVNHNMERYRLIDFNKTRVSVNGTVNANRRISFTGKIDQGDEIRFTANPYLGHNTIFGVSSTVRPFSRFQSVINLDTTDFTDVRTQTTAFNIKILRVQSTYQFTPRLVVRNIMQRNTFNKTLDANLLMTYRVNSGTAFYLGYDDHYMQGDAINAKIYPGSTTFERTNRAVFTKLQYLFRMGGNN